MSQQNKPSLQQALNKLAHDNKIKIEIITNAWGITGKDGTFYIVKNTSDLHELVNNLIKQNA
jgi:hypothetical protein